jgi:uncharacterized protein (UPF0248 family)
MTHQGGHPGVPRMTVRQLLDRICWDSDYGQGEFTVGYFDRVEERIILVPLVKVRFDPGDRSSFQLTDAAGEPLAIPLHRVREVYRNNELIWQRERLSARKNCS